MMKKQRRQKAVTIQVDIPEPGQVWRRGGPTCVCKHSLWQITYGKSITYTCRACKQKFTKSVDMRGKITLKQKRGRK